MYGYSDETEFTNDGVRECLEHINIVLNKFFRRCENEYIQNLQERHFCTKSKFENDSRTYIDNFDNLVLKKEENISRMNWRKRKIVDLMNGNGGLVRGIE